MHASIYISIFLYTSLFPLFCGGVCVCVCVCVCVRVRMRVGVAAESICL